MSSVMKRTAVRLLLFGIPFGLSYWATRPAPQIASNQAVVVCAYPGDRPGELRIQLGATQCSDRVPITASPAEISSATEHSLDIGSELINVSF